MRMLSLPLHTIFWDLSDPRLRKVRRGAWCLLLLPSWKQKVFLKHCCCSTRLHGVILLTPSDPARWRKFPCMIHHTQSTVKVCVSCYVAVHVASKLKLNIRRCIKKFPDCFKQTANRWHHVNVCAMIESWQRRH